MQLSLKSLHSSPSTQTWKKDPPKLHMVQLYLKLCMHAHTAPAQQWLQMPGLPHPRSGIAKGAPEAQGLGAAFPPRSQASWAGTVASFTQARGEQRPSSQGRSALTMQLPETGPPRGPVCFPRNLQGQPEYSGQLSGDAQHM